MSGMPAGTAGSEPGGAVVAAPAAGPQRLGRARQSGALAVGALVFGLGWLFGDVRTRTGWDDTYYLLQVSSLAEDGDLDLRNDALYSRLAPRDLQTFLTATLPSGTLKNTFSVGPALLWLPAYAAGMRQGAGTPAAIRWSRAQLAALHLLSLAFLAGVAWFLYRLLETAGTDRRLALLATLTLLLGTPLAVYGPAVYTMAHLPSAVATSLLVASVLWLERDPRPQRALLAGLALGLVFLVRWQDAVFSLLLWIPLAPFLGRRRDLPRLAKLLAAIAAGGLAMALLQLHVWHLELGSWLTMPQGGDYMRWSQPRLREFLLSGYSGLLAWSPVFALATAGLLLPWRCRLSPRWRVAALAVLVVEVYVDAAVRDWWGGDSFGARRMTSCVPLLAVGLANLAAAATGRWRRPLILALAALGLWGCFTTNLYWHNVRDLSLVIAGTPSLGAREAAASGSDAVTDPALARQRALHPAVNRLHDYFTGIRGVRRSLGILLTAALMAGAVAGSCLVLSRAPARLLLQGALLTLLGIALWGHLRLARGPRPDLAERAVWQRVAEPWSDPRRELAAVAAQAESEAALLDGPAGQPDLPSAADAYRYLAMLASWEGEEPRRALRLLARLAGRGYPAAVGLRRQVEALAAGTEALRLVPGVFFAPRPGAAFRVISVPAAGARSSRTAVESVFELHLGTLESGTVYDVATLQDRNRAELARVSVQGAGEVRLATPRQTVAAGLSLADHPLYQLRLRLDPHAGAVSLEVAGKDGRRTRLSAPLAAGAMEAERLLLGRNRQGHASFPLWSSTFSDLWVTAAAR
jgi:hypothetical protein